MERIFEICSTMKWRDFEFKMNRYYCRSSIMLLAILFFSFGLIEAYATKGKINNKTTLEEEQQNPGFDFQGRHLLKNYPWTNYYPWIQEFEYDRITGCDRVRRHAGDGPAYSMDMVTTHVRILSKSPWVMPTVSADKNFILGKSRGWIENPSVPPQNIYGFKITDPDTRGEKLKVILTAGNHGYEHPSSWVLHAMLDFLVSDDPRAAVIREKAEFYVYPAINPDGKYLSTHDLPGRLDRREIGFVPGRANPGILNKMLPEGLERVEFSREDLQPHQIRYDHNRVWHTTGVFKNIDIIKAAMLKDTGGRVDNLIDFHGCPSGESFTMCSVKQCMDPYPMALAARGINMYLREGLWPGKERLSGWALSDKGVSRAYLTPEISRTATKEQLFKEGLKYALAYYDVVTGQAPEKPVLPAVVHDISPLRPGQPLAGWLFDSDTVSGIGIDPGGINNNVRWDRNTPFSYTDNKALKLDGDSSYVSIPLVDEASRLDFTDNMTVSFWINGKTMAEYGWQYIISKFNYLERSCSWAIAQVPGTRKLMLVLSSDGGHWDMLRYITHDVIDGNWHHVAFSYESGGMGTVRLFVNGAELTNKNGMSILSRAPVSKLPVLENVPLVIGATSDTQSGHRHFFNGMIDELAIWGETLTAQQIRWLSKNSIKEL